MGRKLVNPINDAQSLLLHYLWKKHGGPVAVSRLAGVGMQAANNWRMRGRVPMALLRRVSVALGESMWALNYEGLAKLYGKKERPSWISVVDGCALDKTERDEIVFMRGPVVID